MIWLAVYLLLSLVIQIFLKIEANRFLSLSNLSFLKNLYSRPLVLFAYSMSALNTFVWILVLTEYSLSTATMASSSLYVLFALVDYFIFNVKLDRLNLFGAVFISLGVWFCA
jgi:drug/metabolite transporter (DMT)-like permease